VAQNNLPFHEGYMVLTRGKIAMYFIFFPHCCCSPSRAKASTFLSFLDPTQRRTTFGRTPLDEWSTRRRDLYLTTHNTHNRQTSMPRQDSNPQSQQASGHSDRQYTTLLRASVILVNNIIMNSSQKRLWPYKSTSMAYD